jgi:natural product precursor
MKNLKLNSLEKREMNDIKGGTPGDCCGCACAYANTGGSSSVNNGNANQAGGLNSTASIKRYWCPEEKVWKEI